MSREHPTSLQQQLAAEVTWLDTESLLALITESAVRQPYNFRPQLKWVVDKLQQQQPELVGALLQWLQTRLIRDFSPPRLGFCLTPAVEQLYRDSFKRILRQPTPQQLDDRYYKDLGLASGALFPAGERVVEPFSVLQRSLLYQGGLKQGLNFLQAGLLAGGYRPVFRLHVHLSEQDRFSAGSWRQTCVRLAEMLRVNPKVKGIAGASWFYDPRVLQVSPHLAFVGQLLEEGDAFRFFSHDEGGNSGAFARSSSRRQAFEAGDYSPRNYAIFWPRSRVLNWYRGQQNQDWSRNQSQGRSRGEDG